jgi:hypothetical protein
MTKQNQVFADFNFCKSRRYPVYSLKSKISVGGLYVRDTTMRELLRAQAKSGKQEIEK